MQAFALQAITAPNAALRAVLFNDGQVNVYDVPSGKVLHVLSLQIFPLTISLKAVNFCFSPKNQYLLIANKEHLFVWSLIPDRPIVHYFHSNQLFYQFGGKNMTIKNSVIDEGTIGSLDFSADERRLVVAMQYRAEFNYTDHHEFHRRDWLVYFDLQPERKKWLFKVCAPQVHHNVIDRIKRKLNSIHFARTSQLLFQHELPQFSKIQAVQFVDGSHEEVLLAYASQCNYRVNLQTLQQVSAPKFDFERNAIESLPDLSTPKRTVPALLSNLNDLAMCPQLDVTTRLTQAFEDQARLLQSAENINLAGFLRPACLFYLNYLQKSVLLLKRNTPQWQQACDILTENFRLSNADYYFNNAKKELSSTGANYLTLGLADRDGNIQACAIISMQQQPTAEISNNKVFYVATRGEKGSALGSLMMMAIADYFQAYGCYGIYLHAARVATSFYHSFGMQAVSYKKTQYMSYFHSAIPEDHIINAKMRRITKQIASPLFKMTKPVHYDLYLTETRGPGNTRLAFQNDRIYFLRNVPATLAPGQQRLPLYRPSASRYMQEQLQVEMMDYHTPEDALATICQSRFLR